MPCLPPTFVVVLSLALALSSGCRQDRSDGTATPQDGGNVSSNIATAADDEFATREGYHPGRFVSLPATWTGVEHAHRINPAEPRNRLYHSGFASGGVAIGDVDGDRRPDLFLVGTSEPNRLYRNLGQLKFEEWADSQTDGGEAWGTGAAMVDIDNDGDLDLYVCNYDSPNQLYVNDGTGQFTESAAAWGLDVIDACLMPAFADYDRDGDLDLYLLNNRYYRAGGRPQRPPFEMRDGIPQVLDEFEKFYALKRAANQRFTIEEYGRPDRFLRNDGTRFVDVTEESGISGNGFGLSVTWWDGNGDGWPDIYVCNDFDSPDRYYLNNQDGTFSERSATAMPHTTWSSMGSSAGDINNDGRQDLIAVDMAATTHYKQKTTMGAMNAKKLQQVAGPPPQYMRNALYLNSGTERFMELAFQAGIANSDWSWAPLLRDFDNDGWLDLFVSNGAVRSFNDSDRPLNDAMLVGHTEWELYADAEPRPEQNLAFRNQANLSFADVSRSWGLDNVGISFAAAVGDLDGDADLDLVVINMDHVTSIYRNDVQDGHGLTVSLKGKQSNRFGLGATVELATELGTQQRFHAPYSGFLASHEPILHFGISAGDQPTRLKISWPNGRVQTIDDLPSSGHVEVEEAAVRSTKRQEQIAATPAFRPRALPSSLQHREQTYDDFAVQPLLPNRLSQLGPGLAVGDIDGDGDDDLFMGGAAGQPGTILVFEQDRFQPQPSQALAADRDAEDLGCLFLDFDRDDDLDLYVASGGVETDANSNVLRDRIYINDGSGRFTRAAQDVLPSKLLSSSVVAADDFDHDGDLDLFVGTRVLPGQYPLSGESCLLRNDNGRYVSANDLAPDLANAGMVTGAIWSDVDLDGWRDLLVTTEWGPIRLFKNNAGKLQEQTQAAGLADTLGWWTGISARDFDGDRDIDFVVTNFGLNTKYHASVEQPALLFYGDFENNGQYRLVEASHEEAALFPIRGRSCSTHAMPSLSKRFRSYHEFALADLAKVYTNQCLDDAQRFAANRLETCVLINKGNSEFSIRALPNLAQIAPSFGAVATDVNADGKADIYLAQNFHSAQPETGNMDGGVSLLLTGQADGFQPVWPAVSGLVVAGDAKATVVADFNNNDLLDVVVAVNDGAPLWFEQTAESLVGMPIRVQLVGPIGNRSAIGARVTLVLKDGSSQTAEVQAGGGYLSQSSTRLAFGAADLSDVESIVTHWPDGSHTVHTGKSRANYEIAK